MGYPSLGNNMGMEYPRVNSSDYIVRMCGETKRVGAEVHEEFSVFARLFPSLFREAGLLHGVDANEAGNCALVYHPRPSEKQGKSERETARGERGRQKDGSEFSTLNAPPTPAHKCVTLFPPFATRYMSGAEGYRLKYVYVQKIRLTRKLRHLLIIMSSRHARKPHDDNPLQASLATLKIRN